MNRFEMEYMKAMERKGCEYITPWQMERRLKAASAAFTAIFTALTRGTVQPSYDEIQEVLDLLGSIVKAGKGQEDARP